MLKNWLVSHHPYARLVNAFASKRFIQTSRINESTIISPKCDKVKIWPIKKDLTLDSGRKVIEYINTVGKGNKDVVRAYNTQIHEDIYDCLLNASLNLQSDMFANTVGISSFILLGDCGIGKTTSLKNFAQVAHIACPDVIPVYISYCDVLRNTRLKTKTMLEIAEIQVNQFGIPTDNVEDDVFLRLMDALEANNKHVLLIIDEMDRLYSVNPHLFRWFETLTMSLGELAKIGDDTSGLFAAILCGSSTHLPALVSGLEKNNPVFVKDFPLVEVSVNLNSSKFVPRKIFSTTPVELEYVAHVLYGEDLNMRNRRIVRIVTFITGGKVREISRLSTHVAERVCSHTSRIQENVEHSLLANRTISTQPYGALYDGILTALATKNLDLITKLIEKDGSLDMEQVGKINWEEEFAPLKYVDVETIWKKRIITNEPSGIKYDFDYCLYHLIDNNHIIVDGSLNGKPDKIYPLSVFMVARHRLKQEAIVTTITKIIKILGPLVTEAGLAIGPNKAVCMS